MEPLTYTGMPDIWRKWAMNKLHESRDMQTLHENGITFFDVDPVSSEEVDWNSVTLAGVEDGR